METEVRFNMLLPGYYSLTNLKCNSGNVGWPLPCENRNSGPYSDFLLRLAMGYDKEQIRKTILEHDSVFRHQLHELHRLYGIQRDLMNEIKSKGGEKYLIPRATSHSNPFSCGSKTEDKRKRWQTSESHCSELNCFRLFTSDANGIHSQFSSFKGNAPKSSCCLTKNGLKSKNCESLESQPNKVRTRLFELESPAGEYINNEGGARGVSAKGSYEVSGERNGNLSMLYDSNYSSNGEATSFDLKLKRTRGFTDLNEPIPVEESSSSACVGIPTNVSCSKKEVQRKDLLSMSQLLLAFNQRGVEVFPEPGKARERWISLINPDLEVGSRQNGGGFSNKFENGQPRSNGSFHPEDLQAPHKSVQVETTEARPAMFLSFNENKRGMFGKRKIFGIEIPENGNGVSTVTSHGLDQLSVHSWSDAAHSEILSVSSRAKFNGNSSHNRSWTYGQLSSTALLQDHDITRGKLLGDSNSRSLPSSLAEGLAQNDFLSAFNCKKPRACSPPIGFCSQNGIESKIDSEEFAHRGPKSSFKSLPWMMEAKSTIDLNADTTAADGYEIEEISRSVFDSVNGSIKQNSNGGFSWLRATRPSNVKPNKDVDVSHEINFIDRIEMRIRDSLSTAHVDDPKHRKSDTATAIDGVNSDMTEGPLSIKCGQQCLFEGLVADTSSDHPNANAGRIDLNLCVTEKGIEDIRSTSSVRTNVRIAEIDLEMPMNSEMGTKDTLDYKSLENNLTKPSNVLHGEVDETLGLTSASVAAEALIAISSSCVSYLHQNARSDKSEVSASDSLLWFAEIVTSCRSDTENDVG